MALTPSSGIAVPIASAACRHATRSKRRQRYSMSLANTRAKRHRQHPATGMNRNGCSSAYRFAFSLFGIVAMFGQFATQAFADTSSTSPSSHTATARQFETVEYKRQYGLGLINASDMYARGGTGHGITVGVVDTGLFRNWDLYSRSAGGKYFWPHKIWGWNKDWFDTDGHGTHVAGIIAARKNNIGMHGVAYNASIESLKYLVGQKPKARPDNFLATGINWLANRRGIRIINHSFGIKCRDDKGKWLGIRCRITDFSRSDLYRRYWLFGWRTTGALRYSVPAYLNYVAKGGVAVFSAGNDWQTQPGLRAGLPRHFSELERGWLAVVAVNQSGSLWSKSNACGVARRWCVAAPGAWILSTSNRSRWNQNH